MRLQITDRFGVMFQDEALSVAHRTMNKLSAAMHCIEMYTIFVDTAYGQNGMQHCRFAESGLEEHRLPKGQDKEAMHFRFHPALVPFEAPFFIQTQTLKSGIWDNSWSDELYLPTAIEVSSAAPNSVSITYAPCRVTAVTHGPVLVALDFSQSAYILDL